MRENEREAVAWMTGTPASAVDCTAHWHWPIHAPRLLSHHRMLHWHCGILRTLTQINQRGKHLALESSTVLSNYKPCLSIPPPLCLLGRGMRSFGIPSLGRPTWSPTLLAFCRAMKTGKLFYPTTELIL